MRLFPRTSARGQANLAALGVALLALTTVAGLGLGVADGALAGADRTPLQRHAADGLADRLVAADAPTTYRANVLNESTVTTLTPGDIDALAPAATPYDVRVRLDGETVFQRGDPSGGVTVRRLVLVAARTTDTRTLELAADRTVTLPRRADSLDIEIRPGANTTVTTVRVTDRVVLHDAGGLDGRATVDVPRTDTLRVVITASGSASAPADGIVRITAATERTAKALLEVTVGV